MREPASTSAAALSAVNGGATATSTRSASDSACPRSSATSDRASAAVLCIFQLPQTNFLRATAYSSTSRNVSHITNQPLFLQQYRGVTAAHHSHRLRFGHGAGDSLAPLGPGLLLAEPHGTVPEDGFGSEDVLAIAVEG